jgi:hypothetical protein
MAFKKSLRSRNKDTLKAKFIIFFAKFLHICYEMALLIGLPESSVGRIRSFPLLISFHHGPP